MSVKFKKLNKAVLRKDAHFQFHSEFKTLFAEKLGGETALNALFQQYLAVYNDEDAALQKIRKSYLTEEIKNADKARDKAFAGMAEHCRSLQKHFDALKQDAANRLQIVFNTYGNVAKKTLNEETSAIYNLLQDLRSPKYQAAAAAIGLVDWADELEAKNKALEALVRERDSETEGKTDINLKEARRKLDGIYNDITERAEAYALVGASPEPYLALIETFNVVVDRYVRLLNAGRKGVPAPPDQEDFVL